MSSFIDVSPNEISQANKTDLDWVRRFALDACRLYLSGIWSSVDIEDVVINKISIGLSNYVYSCHIRDEKRASAQSHEPCDVLLKLYGRELSVSGLLQETTFALAMSAHGYGPKVYGVFRSGRIEKFVDAQSPEVHEMFKPDVSRALTRRIAQTHSLELPMKKEPSWLLDRIERFMKVSALVSANSFASDEDKALHGRFLRNNLSAEYDELKPVIQSLPSDNLVFCHNDISTRNMLQLSRDELMFVDFEFAAYNYRGFDIANYFVQLMFNLHYDQYPFFEFKYENFPTYDQRLAFVNAYIKDTVAHKGKASNLDTKQLLHEIDQCVLATLIMFAHLFLIVSPPEMATKFNSYNIRYLEFSLVLVDAYSKFKANLSSESKAE